MVLSSCLVCGGERYENWTSGVAPIIELSFDTDRGYFNKMTFKGWVIDWYILQKLMSIKFNLVRSKVANDDGILKKDSL